MKWNKTRRDVIPEIESNVAEQPKNWVLNLKVLVSIPCLTYARHPWTEGQHSSWTLPRPPPLPPQRQHSRHGHSSAAFQSREVFPTGINGGVTHEAKRHNGETNVKRYNFIAYVRKRLEVISQVKGEPAKTATITRQQIPVNSPQIHSVTTAVVQHSRKKIWSKIRISCGNVNSSRDDKEKSTRPSKKCLKGSKPVFFSKCKKFELWRLDEDIP